MFNHFKQYSTFINKTNQVENTDITFIQDKRVIHTHNKNFQFIGWTILKESGYYYGASGIGEFELTEASEENPEIITEE